MKTKLLSVIGLTLVILASAASVATAQFNPFQLGTLGGHFSEAKAVSLAGHVVGVSVLPDGAQHAFLVMPGVPMADLGTLGGFNSTANAVNVYGLVAGNSVTAGGDTHAFVWTAGGGMVDIGTLGGHNSSATGVNDSGVVVGSAEIASGQKMAFRWTEADGMQALGPLGDFAVINALGAIAWHGRDPGGRTHAFYLWSQLDTSVRSIGIAGAHSTFVSAMNNENTVVGYTDMIAGGQLAYWWESPVGFQTIPLTGGGRATAINNAGIITGINRFSDADWAFRATPGQPMQIAFANTPGNVPYAINEAGVVFGIAGKPAFANGQAFAWQVGASFIQPISGTTASEIRMVRGGYGAGSSTSPAGQKEATVWVFPYTPPPLNLQVGAPAIVAAFQVTGAVVHVGFSPTEAVVTCTVGGAAFISGGILPVGSHTISCEGFYPPTGGSGTASAQVQVVLSGPQGATGATGSAGATGATGATGPAGPAGPMGPQGPQGFNGAGVLAQQEGPGTCPAGGTRLTVVKPTGVLGDVSYICSGVNGAAGATGAQGAQGAQGATGAAGAAGAIGQAGPAGAVGAMGAQGLTGPIGSQGPIGMTGADGVAGPQGTKGDIGNTGAQGAQGPIGMTGAAGANGADGAAGAQGSVGPAGADGVDGATGAAGALGPIGPAGATGAAGAQGPIGMTGAAGANGADGAAGAQGSAGLAGADGAVGPQGGIGAQGAMGPLGPAGAQGNAGPTGTQGPRGDTGAIGPQGAAGTAGTNLVQLPGSILLMMEGVAPPAGYARVGTFVEERIDADGRGGQRPARMRIVMWRKL